MLDLHAQKETTVNASPEVVFDILTDLTRHPELAGSQEVLKVRKLTGGPVGLGTVFEADERISVGGQAMEFAATSVVVAFEPQRTISWISAPPFPNRRIQWWYRLTPQAGGTHVVEEVEVDLGEQEDPQLKALKDNYETMRAGDVRRGMEKTLENLKRMAKGRVAAR